MWTQLVKIPLSFMILCLSIGSFVFGASAPSDGFWSSKRQQDDTTRINIWWIENSEWVWDGLEVVIQSFINTFLAALWIIALIVLIRWGIKMLTAAGNEDKYNSWFKYIKNAFIGLFIIWLSRFIVSFIFWAVNLVATGAGEEVWFNVIYLT